ncbi:RNA polymerase sigma factor [Microbacterium sp. No. 7]|uniref:RNA polymerase sigma factor n=1 Tax=Microbacterium sp. No. 7 TaxID=1714373 RepID=UPI0006D02147|nr:RNA polymerase sigma factor [Microbacterium sp. No. 7]ALJ20797.1 RNA polymerase subunit sigma-70 [Microbacterium sp. No. 7]
MTTDSAIIRRSLDDPSAFGALFDRHARDIGVYARQRVGAEGAQDVLSETFLVAFRRRASFDHAWESARPWLFGIATRLVRAHRADQARQWRAIEAAAGVVDADSDGGLARADERTDAAVRARALAGRIAHLAARDRDTLLLYAWSDLTYEEIAAALRVPVGTVRSRLHRVRRLLADEREEGDDG